MDTAAAARQALPAVFVEINEGSAVPTNAERTRGADNSVCKKGSPGACTIAPRQKPQPPSFFHGCSE